jgi:hypothetical protein
VIVSRSKIQAFPPDGLFVVWFTYVESRILAHFSHQPSGICAAMLDDDYR